MGVEPLAIDDPTGDTDVNLRALDTELSLRHIVKSSYVFTWTPFSVAPDNVKYTVFTLSLGIIRITN